MDSSRLCWAAWPSNNNKLVLGSKSACVSDVICISFVIDNLKFCLFSVCFCLIKSREQKNIRKCFLLHLVVMENRREP